MNSITSLIPRAKPVTIAAAGITVRVSEFTLNDLADLQSILDADWPDPIYAAEVAASRLEGDPETREKGRKRLLADAYERAAKGPPIYGEASGNAFYATMNGIASLLWVALRKNHPELTPQGAAEIALKLSVPEYSLIWRIAHGSQTLKSLERMLGLGLADKPQRETTWGQIVEEVIQSHPGWTYPDVYNLTITEWLNARRKGRPIRAGVPIPMDANMQKRIAEQRAIWAKLKGES